MAVLPTAKKINTSRGVAITDNESGKSEKRKPDAKQSISVSKLETESLTSRTFPDISVLR